MRKTSRNSVTYWRSDRIECDTWQCDIHLTSVSQNLTKILYGSFLSEWWHESGRRVFIIWIHLFDQKTVYFLKLSTFGLLELPILSLTYSGLNRSFENKWAFRFDLWPSTLTRTVYLTQISILYRTTIFIRFQNDLKWHLYLLHSSFHLEFYLFSIKIQCDMICHMNFKLKFYHIKFLLSFQLINFHFISI